VVPLSIYTGAEALHGFRHTQKTLRRADRLAVVAVGTVFAVGLIVILVSLISGSFS